MGGITPFGDMPKAAAAAKSTAAAAELLSPTSQPDLTDEALRNARLMERRKQLGLQGRMSTFLTTAQGDQAPAQPTAPTNTLLGG